MKSSSVDVGCIRIMKQFSTISLFKFDESNTDSLCRKQMSFHGPHYLTFELIRGTSTSETANNDVKYMIIFSQHGTNSITNCSVDNSNEKRTEVGAHIKNIIFIDIHYIITTRNDHQSEKSIIVQS